MRIAYVCADNGVPIFGTKGCSVHVQEGIRSLRAQGAEVAVFARRLGGRPPTDLRDCSVFQVPGRAHQAVGSKEQAALMANLDLTTLLEQEGPFDLVYERYSLWSHAGIDHAWYHRIPGLLEVNAPLIEEQAKYRRLQDRQSAEWVSRHVFGRATALLAVSRLVARYVETYSVGPGRVHVVANGVNEKRFRPGRTPTLPALRGVFTVGFVGSLKPWHGLPDLVEAFSRFHDREPASRLLIVGEGPEYASVQADLVARGLETSAILTGSVQHDAVPGLLASMDVAVAPYPQLEQSYFSPLKLFEYMAAGVPVVASRMGQVAEVLKDGQNGLLYTPGSVSELAENLATVAGDSVLRSRLARAARATVIRNHTWTAVARQVLELADFVRADSLQTQVAG